MSSRSAARDKRVPQLAHFDFERSEKSCISFSIPQCPSFRATRGTLYFITPKNKVQTRNYRDEINSVRSDTSGFVLRTYKIQGSSFEEWLGSVVGCQVIAPAQEVFLNYVPFIVLLNPVRTSYLVLIKYKVPHFVQNDKVGGGQEGKYKISRSLPSVVKRRSGARNASEI